MLAKIYILLNSTAIGRCSARCWFPRVEIESRGREVEKRSRRKQAWAMRHAHWGAMLHPAGHTGPKTGAGAQQRTSASSAQRIHQPHTRRRHSYQMAKSTKSKGRSDAGFRRMSTAPSADHHHLVDLHSEALTQGPASSPLASWHRKHSPPVHARSDVSPGPKGRSRSPS